MEFKEYDSLYRLGDDIDFSNVRSLDKLENYVDYALHKTVETQMPSLEDTQNLNIEEREKEERELARIAFTRFLGGDFKAFISDDNIQINMVSIPIKRFNQMLLKNTLELVAYHSYGYDVGNVSENDLKICEDIVNRMGDDEYTETANLIVNDPEYRRAAINAYISFKYGNKDKDDVTNMTFDRSFSKASFGLRNMDIAMEKEAKLGVSYRP